MPEQFEQLTDAAPQGVGAALSVNGHTRAMEKFFGNLPPHYGVAQDQDRLHVTILSADENAIDINSKQDLILLRNAGREFHRRLASLPLEGMVFHPAGDELAKFGRYLAIPLRSTTYMEYLRQDLIEISAEELGASVDSEAEWHLSVVRPGRTRVKTRANAPSFPDAVHVDGFDIQHRVFDDPDARKGKQKYRNRPQGRVLRQVG